MTAAEIKNITMCGETSTKQFKLLFNTAEDIANELVAFANSQGGSIFIGVDDKTGEIKGLDFQQLRNIGQLISSAAESRVHPAVYPTVETIPVDGKPVMILSIGKGVDAPYTNNKGEIYVKQGPDKRRVTDNNEILRLFASSGNYHVDQQGVPRTSFIDIDTFALEDYFQKSLGKSIDELGLPLEKVLQNLNILTADGQLTLGGLMYFGKNPQRYCPAFNIKAVWFYGNSIGGTEYHDSKDINGTIPRMFQEGMRFVESILHRRQAGQNFNSIGKLEIPEVAISELLQNSLTHRSWLKPAPIRLLVFDNRVEIINPGALPNNLTVDDIKLGNAYQRNQLIANLCAKTMDYRGLGSGIIRALKTDADIEFRNEASGDQFRAILWRMEQRSDLISDPKSDLKDSQNSRTSYKSDLKNGGEDEDNLKSNLKSNLESNLKSDLKIIQILQDFPETTIPELGLKLGLSRSGIKKILSQLKKNGKIRRIGPDKGGHWEVL